MSAITDQLEGAQIVSVEIDENEEGMHFYLNNGFCVIVIGTVGLLKVGTEKLH